MTINLRIALWLLLAMALFLNYEVYQHDYAPVGTPPPTAAHAPGASSGAPPSAAPSAPLGATPPTVSSLPAKAAAKSTPEASSVLSKAAARELSRAVPSAGVVHVRTDVLDLEVGLAGGELSSAKLLAYPVSKSQPDVPVHLLNTTSAKTLYVLQGGLAGTAGEAAPTHQAVYSSPVRTLTLAPGKRQLELPLTWSNGHGVTVTKTLTFRRGSYAIGVDYRVRNDSAQPYVFAPYAQVLRYNQPVKHSYFDVTSYLYKGPAIFDGSRFQTLDLAKKPTLDRSFRHGWLAGLQAYFCTAIVPPAGQSYHYTLNTRGDEYLLKATGPVETVAPGASASVMQQMFVGPELQDQLDLVSPRLDLVTDYGYLTFLARPLFWLLEHIQDLIGNWGFTIIIVTMLLRLALYPLSEASGRSMAKMKALGPRLTTLRENYKDDKEKLNRAMMELYQREKVNPLAGCLPMLVQIPVFFAFYYVLRGSAELRDAPFLFWISDLSARDPYYVLPAIMAAASYFQFKINPQVGADPTQQKIMMIMPLAMSALFAFFPAGLVLYYTTSTLLSALQQWNINRRIEAAAAHARR